MQDATRPAAELSLTGRWALPSAGEAEAPQLASAPVTLHGCDYWRGRHPEIRSPDSPSPCVLLQCLMHLLPWTSLQPCRHLPLDEGLGLHGSFAHFHPPQTKSLTTETIQGRSAHRFAVRAPVSTTVRVTDLLWHLGILPSYMSTTLGS